MGGAMKRTKSTNPKVKRRTVAKRSRVTRHIHVAPAALIAQIKARSRNPNVAALIVAVIGVAVLAGLAAWPRPSIVATVPTVVATVPLALMNDSPVARMDDAAFAREI